MLLDLRQKWFAYFISKLKNTDYPFTKEVSIFQKELNILFNDFHTNSRDFRNYFFSVKT